MLQPWKLHQKKGMCQLASCLPLPTWLSAWIGIAGYGSCRKGVGKVLDFGNLAIVDLWSNLQNVHNSPKPEEKLEIRKQTSQASLLVISSGFKFETLKTSQNCSPTWAACCWHRHGQAPGLQGWVTTSKGVPWISGQPLWGLPVYNFSKCKRTDFGPYDLIPGWKLQGPGICFLIFCVFFGVFFYQNGGSCKATFSFSSGMVEVLRVATPMKERESLKTDVARILGGKRISKKTGRVLLISNPFLSFPYAENTASESFFPKLEPVWLQLQSMFQKFLPFPIIQSTYLKHQTYKRPPWLAAPMGSSLLASNRTSLPWRLGRPAEFVWFAFVHNSFCCGFFLNFSPISSEVLILQIHLKVEILYDSYENNCGFFNRQLASGVFLDGQIKAPPLRRLRRYSSTPFPSSVVL